MEYRKLTDIRIAVLVISLMVFLPGPSKAFEKGMGGLIGSLFAGDGTSPVPNVDVTLRNVSTEEIIQVRTNENGIFKVENLENGFYVYGVSTQDGNYNSDNLIGVKNDQTTKVSIVLAPFDDRSAAAANDIYQRRNPDDEALIGRVESYDPLTRQADIFIIYGFMQKNDRIHVEGRRTEFYQDVFDLNLENRPIDKVFAGSTAKVRMEREVEKGDEVYILCKKSGALPLFLAHPCGIAALVAGAGFITLGIIELQEEVNVSPFKTKK